MTEEVYYLEYSAKGLKLDPNQVEKARRAVSQSEKSLTPDAIRSLLEREGYEEPVIDYVTRVSTIELKKYKSAVIKGWEK